MIEQRGIEALEGWSTAGVVLCMMLSGGSWVEVEIKVKIVEIRLK